MEQRRFGRTGFDISAFTLGGGIVGGILINAPEETRLEALRRIVAAGCTWVDTAGDYGGGESELALGRLLPEVTPRPRLSTKVRLDMSRLDDLEGQIRRSIELSLERLRAGSGRGLPAAQPDLGNARRRHDLAARRAAAGRRCRHLRPAAPGRPLRRVRFHGPG